MLQTHVTGVMLQGRHTYMVIDCNEYPHDSNWSINCLLYCLLEEFGQRRLPPTLYLHVETVPERTKTVTFWG